MPMRFERDPRDIVPMKRRKKSSTPSSEPPKEVPLDGFSGEPIPEWAMREHIMQILDEVKAGRMTIPIARENVIYIARNFSPESPQPPAESEELEEWEKDIRGHFLQKGWEEADGMVEFIRNLLTQKVAEAREGLEVTHYFDKASQQNKTVNAWAEEVERAVKAERERIQQKIKEIPGFSVFGSKEFVTREDVLSLLVE